MSATIKSSLSQLIDFIAEIEKEGKLETHKESMERVKKLLADFDGDIVQLALFGDRLRKIGKEIWDNTKESAFNQLRLEGVDSKTQRYGNTITPRETVSYDLGEYEEDPQIQMYKEKEEEAKEEKDKWRDQRKKREEKLVQEGRYEKKEVTRTLSIDRK